VNVSAGYRRVVSRGANRRARILAPLRLMIENLSWRPRPAAAHSSGLRKGSATFACGLVQQLAWTRLGSAAHSASVEVNSATSTAVCCWVLLWKAGLAWASTRRW
jgi:hypothetical protein